MAQPPQACEAARTNHFPLLMMPSTAANSFFCVVCNETHHDPLLPADARGARFCGSFPGGWLVAELPQPRGDYALLNLLTGVRVPLPNRLFVPGPDDVKMRPVVLHAVTLSAPPPAGPGPVVGLPCYAAAIVRGQSNIAFWCPRAANCWFPPVWSLDPSDESWHGFLPENRIEDVIYYSGEFYVGFYVLTDKEDLLMFWPAHDGDGVGAPLSTYTVRYSFPGHRATEPAPGQTVSRYLVVSRQRLLMIVRFDGPDHRTSFDVFMLEEVEMVGEDHSDAQVLASWRRCRRNTTTLSGRRIFLGRGCSIAVDVGDPCPLYIYFLDDGRRPNGDLSTAGNPPYPCSETGMFYFNHDVVRCFPRGPPSDCSPWIWFFLSDETFRTGELPPEAPAGGWLAPAEPDPADSDGASSSAGQNWIGSSVGSVSSSSL